jgi:hypothetical protein
LQDHGVTEATLRSALRITGLAAAIDSDALREDDQLIRRAERCWDDAVARLYFAEAALGCAMLSSPDPVEPYLAERRDQGVNASIANE